MVNECTIKALLAIGGQFKFHMVSLKKKTILPLYLHKEGFAISNYMEVTIQVEDL